MSEPVERTAGDPRGSIPFYRALLSVVLFLLLSASGLAYLWTMRNLYPGVAILRVPTAEEHAGPPVRQGDPLRVLVIQPNENIACAKARGFDLWAQAVHWQGLADAMGLQVDVGSETRIPANKSSLDAIVVPWLICLSESERERIDRFAAAGGGVVTAGAFDVAGKPATAFEAEARFVVPSGRTAPGSALAPGRRLELPKDSVSYSSESGTAILWWSQWGLQPAPPEAATWQPAATLSQGDGGRRVWFGFPAAQAAEGSEAELDRVRSLALLWAAGDDVVALSPWPKAHPFAWVTALNVQGGDEEVTGSLDGAEALGLEPTVFVHADVDGLEPSTRRRLGAVPEIGSRGDRRTRFDGGTRIHQRQKLVESRDRLSVLSTLPVRGLRVPRELFDDLTLHESVQAGYEYVLGDPGFDRSYPRWVSAEGRSIALVSRAGAGDDHSYTRDDHVAGFAEDLRRSRELGGLYVMALDAPRLHDLGLRKELATVLGGSPVGRPWKATAGEVVRWVAARKAIGLEPAGKGLIRLSNRSDHDVDGLTLEVFGSSGLPTRLRVPALKRRSEVTLRIESETVAIGPRTGPASEASDLASGD